MRAAPASACICAGPAITDTIVTCAVFEGGQLIRASRRFLPWGEITALLPSRANVSSSRHRWDAYALLGASAQIGGATGRRLYVARLLDERMARY
jgi:hypothetical protein